MSSYIPITLEGSNLKERHRYINALVRRAYDDKAPIKEIIDIPERSAIDRIFKIELASKYKYIEFILENFKNDDMLFVNRSLKCVWLLESEYKDIINPSYLENNLYLDMIQPAVNKIKHWLQLNLKDAARCQDFYNHYKDNIDYAINFFWRCSQNFILSEFPNVIDKLTPVHLKILFEKYPAACGLYFEILPNNRMALQRYSCDENYFKCVKYLLKYDGNLFLNIVEKYFNMSRFNPFGASLTKIIMKNYKTRVLDKIELYVSSVLHLKTLALHLNSEEANQIILKLARAEFLNYWFSFQKVEPILKRVIMEHRKVLKKQVFVDKAITNMIKEWPYLIPTPLDINEEEEYHIISDIEHQPYEYCSFDSIPLRRKLLKRCAKSCRIVSAGKSPLDKLFDRYRFVSFEKSFYELTKNMLFEGSVDARLNIILVLVSKSGGISEQVEKLLRFLVQRHKNEPNTLRAAVIRSLVKRECVWRVQDQVWDLLLQFGWDIGLDGMKADLVCREGLHAVIVRHLLNDNTIAPTLVAGFLECFSTLSEYKFNVNEKMIIAKRLPKILYTSNPDAFLECLAEYNLRINDFPEAKPFLIKAAKEDPNLVCRLFDAKIFRRELLREAFKLKQNDAMYLNALRHDITLLDNGKSFATLTSKERPKHDRFLYSLCLYFSEPGGLAEKHQKILKGALDKEPNIWLLRPLCILMPTPSLLKLLSDLDIEKINDKKKLRILSVAKSNAHKCKPVLNINTVDWRQVGVKTVSNKILICRIKDRQIYLKRLLEHKKTAKLSLRLSHKRSDFVNVFLQVCTLRPSAALKNGLKLLFTENNIDMLIWNALKSLIMNIKYISKNKKLLRKLEDPNSVPRNIEADYWSFVFQVFLNIDKKQAMPILCRVENNLPEVDKNFIRNVVQDFIEVDLSPEKFNIDCESFRALYFRIVAKYLLLCKSDDEQKILLENVFEKFFNAIEVLFQIEKNQLPLQKSLDVFVSALKYTKSFLGDYFTCMPVFERILTRLHKILPIKENFNTYAEIHLTMLYFKAIRHAIELKSNLFENPKNCKQGIEIVGEIFGTFIAHEIKELVSRYFRSVVEIYKDVLYQYLRNHFDFNKTRSLFITFIIRGILKVETVNAYLLAGHIFGKEQESISMTYKTEITNVFKKFANVEVKFFLYAHVLNAINLNRCYS